MWYKRLTIHGPYSKGFFAGVGFLLERFLPFKTRIDPVEFIEKHNCSIGEEKRWRCVFRFTLGAKQLSHKRLNDTLDDLIKVGDDT